MYHDLASYECYRFPTENSITEWKFHAQDYKNSTFGSSEKCPPLHSGQQPASVFGKDCHTYMYTMKPLKKKQHTSAVNLEAHLLGFIAEDMQT